MKIQYSAFLFIFIGILNSGCNSLHKISTITIEIVEPSTMSISNDYKQIAVQYNNVNASPGTNFNEYERFGQNFTETENSDSIASHIYFESFIYEINKQDFFDTVLTLNARDYSNIRLVDTLNYKHNYITDSVSGKKLTTNQINVFNSSYFLRKATLPVKPKEDSIFFHSRFGLYTPEQLQAIRNQTGANMLLSLDFFGATDGRYFYPRSERAKEVVINWAQWSFYDLDNMQYLLSHSKLDTVSWIHDAWSLKEARNAFPPRNDAIYNAAEISAEKYAYTLVPHWVKVQRMYYPSGHVELKHTMQLIKDGDWLKAALLWKKHTTNKNKIIVAKCMFNMGLACEMQGNLEAALEWVVKSYHVFGAKKPIHAQNCMNYIRLLSTRQADLKVLAIQFGDQ